MTESEAFISLGFVLKKFDHLVPLAIGGANAIANPWPKPWAEADQKDVLEV